MNEAQFGIWCANVQRVEMNCICAMQRQMMYANDVSDASNEFIVDLILPISIFENETVATHTHRHSANPFIPLVCLTRMRREQQVNACDMVWLTWCHWFSTKSVDKCYMLHWRLPMNVGGGTTSLHSNQELREGRCPMAYIVAITISLGESSCALILPSNVLITI